MILNYKYICKLIEKTEGYTHDELIINSRKRELVLTRQLCMYFAFTKTNISGRLIGKYYGGKDHSTVSYAIKTITNLYDTDKSIKEKIDYYDSQFIKLKNRLYACFPLLLDTINFKEMRLLANVSSYKVCKDTLIPSSTLSRIENNENESMLYHTAKRLIDYYRQKVIDNETM